MNKWYHSLTAEQRKIRNRSAKHGISRKQAMPEIARIKASAKGEELLPKTISTSESGLEK